MNNKTTLPVGVSVLMTLGFKLLLGVRKNNSAAGLYSTPGGRLEQDEDIIKCAIREVKEETGVMITNAKIIHYMEHFRYGKHYIMFYVHARFWEGEISNLEPDKCEEWLWFDLDKLPENCTEPSEVINKLQGEL